MTDISHNEAVALVAVLSLAENHQMWSNPASHSETFKAFVDEQYAHISTVREFLKRNGIVTLHEISTRLVRDFEEKRK